MTLSASEKEDSPQVYEDRHVHQVYEEIASHFSSTRSEKLVQIAAQHQPHTSIIAENLALPHPDFVFDFAVSIAVIHHLSTPERRIQAIAAILRTLRPVAEERCTETAAPGMTLIYVWALEQKSSRRGWDEGDEQDVMVPWVMKHTKGKNNDGEAGVYNRYYHLYRQGELEHDILQAGGCVIDSGYEKDNWWAIASPKQVMT
ncbi:MAG: hypothetical protein Q9167_001400 [Letrouitia subvulpina]